MVLLEQTQRAQCFDARGVARRRSELARRQRMFVDCNDSVGRVCRNGRLAGVVVSLNMEDTRQKRGHRRDTPMQSLS